MPETEELEIAEPIELEVAEPEVVSDGLTNEVVDWSNRENLSFWEAKGIEGVNVDFDSTQAVYWVWSADFSDLMAASTSEIVFSSVLAIWSIICMWRMFNKAWLPGWGAIIPFYNLYLWFKLAWRSGWWLLSILFPPLLLIIVIITYFDVAKRFGKSAWFWVWLLFFNPIFEWILAFDKSEYHKK